MSVAGQFALWMALALCGWATVASVAGAVRAPHRGDRRALIASAEWALLIAALALTGAAGMLVTLLIRRDFTVSYVAYNTSLNLPTAYAITAFWAAPAGSLLLFAWLTSATTTVATFAERRWHRVATPFATSVMSFMLGGLVLALIVGANPFAPFDGVTSDGRGLTPQLQHRWAAVHPPLMYLGFAAAVVPFARTIGALWTRRRDAGWLASTRRWMLFTWTATSAALLVGMRWAYLEEGWGGFWSWDIVQNSALLPWLVCSLFLHAHAAPAKRTIMSLLPFPLTLLGAYLSRNGVVASVHAFVTPGMGAPTQSSVWMLNLLLIALVGAGLVLWARREVWLADGPHEEGARADVMLTVATWLLLAMSVVVVWGMLFPLVADALHRPPVVLGPSFYQGLGRPIAVLAALAIAVSGVSMWRGRASRPVARSLHQRVAAVVAHVGVLAILCACAGAAFSRDVTGVMRTGDTLSLTDAFGGRWLFASQGLSTYDEINRQVLGVSVSVRRDGKSRGMLASVQRQYMDGNGDAVFDPTTETAVRSTWREDVRMVFLNSPERDAAVVRLTVQPLVGWLWIGGALVVLAGLISLWPSAHPSEHEEEPPMSNSMSDPISTPQSPSSDVGETVRELDAAEALIARARALQRVCPDCGPCPEPNAKFCSNCGQSLPGICRHCGAALAKPDARFCSECGAAQGR